MKHYITLVFLLCAALPAAGQDDISRGNGCYDKKDWSCALDAYSRVLSANSFKQEELHVLEFRIGYCLAKTGKLNEALGYYARSSGHKSTYLYPWWNAGNIYFDTGRYDSAVICYQQAAQLADKPEDRDLMYYFLGDTYFSQKRYAQSASAFMNVQGRKGSCLITDARMAEAYLLLAKYDSAMRHIRNAYRVITPAEPSYKNTLLVHGRIYRNQGLYDSAVIVLGKALTIDPNYASATWEMGLVYAGQRNYPQAIVWYNKALPYYAKDTANTYTLLNNIRNSYSNMGDYANAAKSIERLIPYASNPLEEYRKLAGLQYGKLKETAHAEGTARLLLSKSTQRWDSVTSTNRNNRAFGNALIAKILLEKKDTTSAAGMLREALRLQNDHFESNLYTGDIHWNRGKRQEALPHYLAPNPYTRDTFITSNMDIARFYGRRAFCRYAKNSKDATSPRMDAEDALKYDSMQKEAIQVWATVLVEATYYTDKRRQCIALINQAAVYHAKDNPYVSEIYNLQALLYNIDKDTLHLHQSLKKAVGANPDNLSAWDNLLKFYDGTNRFDEGIATANTLFGKLKGKKENAQVMATVLLYKGDFLWKQGKKEQAKLAWSEALTLDPSSKEAKSRVDME